MAGRRRGTPSYLRPTAASLGHAITPARTKLVQRKVERAREEREAALRLWRQHHTSPAARPAPQSAVSTGRTRPHATATPTLPGEQQRTVSFAPPSAHKPHRPAPPLSSPAQPRVHRKARPPPTASLSGQRRQLPAPGHSGQAWPAARTQPAAVRYAGTQALATAAAAAPLTTAPPYMDDEEVAVTARSPSPTAPPHTRASEVAVRAPSPTSPARTMTATAFDGYTPATQVLASRVKALEQALQQQVAAAFAASGVHSEAGSPRDAARPAAPISATALQELRRSRIRDGRVRPHAGVVQLPAPTDGPERGPSHRVHSVEWETQHMHRTTASQHQAVHRAIDPRHQPVHRATASWQHRPVVTSPREALAAMPPSTPATATPQVRQDRHRAGMRTPHITLASAASTATTPGVSLRQPGATTPPDAAAPRKLTYEEPRGHGIHPTPTPTPLPPPSPPPRTQMTPPRTPPSSSRAGVNGRVPSPSRAGVDGRVAPSSRAGVNGRVPSPSRAGVNGRVPSPSRAGVNGRVAPSSRPLPSQSDEHVLTQASSESPVRSTFARGTASLFATQPTSAQTTRTTTSAFQWQAGRAGDTALGAWAVPHSPSPHARATLRALQWAQQSRRQLAKGAVPQHHIDFLAAAAARQSRGHRASLPTRRRVARQHPAPAARSAAKPVPPRPAFRQLGAGVAALEKELRAELAPLTWTHSGKSPRVLHTVPLAAAPATTMAATSSLAPGVGEASGRLHPSEGISPGGQLHPSKGVLAGGQLRPSKGVLAGGQLHPSKGVLAGGQLSPSEGVSPGSRRDARQCALELMQRRCGKRVVRWVMQRFPDFAFEARVCAVCAVRGIGFEVEVEGSETVQSAMRSLRAVMLLLRDEDGQWHRIGMVKVPRVAGVGGCGFPAVTATHTVSTRQADGVFAPCVTVRVEVQEAGTLRSASQQLMQSHSSVEDDDVGPTFPQHVTASAWAVAPPRPSSSALPSASTPADALHVAAVPILPPAPSLFHTATGAAVPPPAKTGKEGMDLGRLLGIDDSVTEL